jgi:hypothetical protein
MNTFSTSTVDGCLHRTSEAHILYEIDLTQTIAEQRRAAVKAKQILKTKQMTYMRETRYTVWVRSFRVFVLLASLPQDMQSLSLVIHFFMFGFIFC